MTNSERERLLEAAVKAFMFCEQTDGDRNTHALWNDRRRAFELGQAALASPVDTPNAASCTCLPGHHIAKRTEWRDCCCKCHGCLPNAPVDTPSTRTYPFECELCLHPIASKDDLDWHGIGNCVRVCDTCTGSGIDPADDVKKMRFHKSAASAPVPASGYSAQEVLEARLDNLAERSKDVSAALKEIVADMRKTLAAAQPASRSTLKREAILKGEPMPGPVCACQGLSHEVGCYYATKL